MAILAMLCCAAEDRMSEWSDARSSGKSCEVGVDGEGGGARGDEGSVRWCGRAGEPIRPVKCLGLWLWLWLEVVWRLSCGWRWWRNTDEFVDGEEVDEDERKDGEEGEEGDGGVGCVCVCVGAGADEGTLEVAAEERRERCWCVGGRLMENIFRPDGAQDG